MKDVTSELESNLKMQRKAMTAVLELLTKANTLNRTSNGSKVVGSNLEEAIEILKKTLEIEDAEKGEAMLERTSIDGSEWGGLLKFLVTKHGAAAFSKERHKGKTGCVDYLQSARMLAAGLSTARSVKEQERSRIALSLLDKDIGRVKRLYDVSEAQRIAAIGANSPLPPDK